MHPSRLWYGKDALAISLRILLTPVSWLYGAGWQIYLGTYKRGFKRDVAPHAPIICVGNLVAGGTGKTPTTINLVQVLLDLGQKVVVSASGYGSPAAEAAQIAPEGSLNSATWGDEPALMRLKLPAIPLIVGRRRVLAATLAHQRFPAHILVLDDGFQHLPLRKDLTILLDPPTSNSSCLPAGPYREPKSNRTRADLCLPDQFQLKRRIASLAQVNGEEMTTPTHATALCAIAQPDKFVESLGARGISVTRLIALSDHNPLTEGTLMLPDDPSEAVVVTEKDWVKLRDRADLGQRQIWIAIEEATIEPAKEFRDWLASKLDAIKAKGA